MIHRRLYPISQQESEIIARIVGRKLEKDEFTIRIRYENIKIMPHIGDFLIVYDGQGNKWLARVVDEEYTVTEEKEKQVEEVIAEEEINSEERELYLVNKFTLKLIGAFKSVGNGEVISSVIRAFPLRGDKVRYPTEKEYDVLIKLDKKKTAKLGNLVFGEEELEFNAKKFEVED